MNFQPEYEPLRQLADQHGFLTKDKVEYMLGGGSGKRFFRMQVNAYPSSDISSQSCSYGSIVGVLAETSEQVKQFTTSTNFFASQGLPVVRCLATGSTPPCYLLEDLGNWTLSQRLQKWRINKTDSILPALSKVVSWLPRFQWHGTQGFNRQQLPIRNKINHRTIQKDWQTFTQFFIKEHHRDMLPSMVKAQADINQLLTQVADLEGCWFCYRDFHCRNIMWPAEDATGGPIFIDYQDGMQGPLAYDLISLLYSPDTGINSDQRAQLTTTYLEVLAQTGLPVPADFSRQCLLLTWQRRTQALGAYARIAKQGKSEFLAKIPVAVADLLQLLKDNQFPSGLPSLQDWIKELLEKAAALNY